MQAAKSVLLIEDNLVYAQSICDMFNNQGPYPFLLVHAASINAAQTQLAVCPADVVLLDLGLANSHGLEAVRKVRTVTPRVAIVLLVESENESSAIKAMQEGAQDYLVKDQIKPRELMRALRNAIERKFIEESLFQAKERAEVTLDCIGDAVICTDLAGNISFLNPAAETMTGWSLQESVGLPLAEAFRIMDPDTRAITPNPMAMAVEQDRIGSLPANCVLIRRDQHECFIEDSVAPIHDRDGVVTGSVLIFRDASVPRALAAQIVHLAEHDSLTGLSNRTLLNDRLSQAIAYAARHNGQLAVLFMDLDGFKHVNDSLGHPTGDKLLQSVAKQIEGCVRTPDTVSRQGGDEFLVLLQDLQKPDDAAIAAIRVLKAVAKPHLVDSHDLSVTASIGVSVYPEDGVTAAILIKNADTAMYQAKESGRNTYRFFKPEMNVRAVKRRSLGEDLRHALEQDEFSLHYQPKINLQSGAICGVEALIRWKHRRRAFIPPFQFIPIAEDFGLILPIGAWVLSEACSQSKAWVNAGLPPITMAVNVSTIQFQNDGFLDCLFAILSETSMDPMSLELEFTESILMRNAGLAASVLQTLKDCGVRVAIDDFGTGFSSLNYLRKFPLDALKIDRSFVSEITRGAEDAALVTAMIKIARSLKLQVIAEGVETPEQLAFLKAEGCDEAQGYLFGRPVPANQFARLLEHQMAMVDFQ